MSHGYEKNIPGIMAPMQTRVAWPPQKACIPNHIDAMKTRRMTGTSGRVCVSKLSHSLLRRITCIC